MKKNRIIFDVPDRYESIQKALDAGLSNITIRPVKIKTNMKLTKKRAVVCDKLEVEKD